jgi:hypothetical protein
MTLAWSAATQYSTGNTVLYNNIYYTALRANRNVVPNRYTAIWRRLSGPPTIVNPSTIAVTVGNAELNLTSLFDLFLSQNINLSGINTTMPLKSLLSTVFSRVSVADASLASITADIADLQAVDAAFSAQDALQELAIATVSADLILNTLQDSSVASSVSALSGRIDVIEGNVPSFALAADLSALDGRVGSAENAISAKADASALSTLEGIATSIRSDLSSAIAETATKASSADVATVASNLASAVVRLDVVEITAGAAATASALEALDSRVTANELALPTKAADADLQAAVGRLDGLDVLVAQKADTTYVDAIDANLASIDSVSAVESRVSAVESALPAKAEQSALDAAVSTLEASIATKAASLTVSDAADYAALIALGSAAIGRISSSITLDAFAAIGTVVRALAAGAVSLGDLEMQDGEIYTAIKLADGWAFFVGTSVAAASASAPPAPVYPDAWFSLPTGDYTAVRRAATEADVPSGFTMAQLYPEGTLVEIKDSSSNPISAQTNYIWFEVNFGEKKVNAASSGSPGTEGFFTSGDAIQMPLASYTHVLISVGGTDSSNAAVTYRIAIA